MSSTSDPYRVVCSVCHEEGDARWTVPGNLGLEFLLYFLSLPILCVAGLIYSGVRGCAAHWACDVCGARDVVPVGSVHGKSILSERQRGARAPDPSMGALAVDEDGLRQTIQEYLDLCYASAPRSTAEAERALPLLLDRLALASNEPAPPDEASAEVEAPDLEYDAVRKQVGERFPNYGLYTDADTEPAAEPTVGDAIDDLCDIAIDLSEVAWLWDHAGELAGRWQFHFSFDTHWGAHLRSLQWYVHEIAWDGS